MACACKNKTSNAQVTRVKQVVKTKNVAPVKTTTSENTGHKVTKRVIYRRSV